MPIDQGIKAQAACFIQTTSLRCPLSERGIGDYLLWLGCVVCSWLGIGGSGATFCKSSGPGFGHWGSNADAGGLVEQADSAAVKASAARSCSFEIIGNP